MYGICNLSQAERKQLSNFLIDLIEVWFFKDFNDVIVFKKFKNYTNLLWDEVKMSSKILF